MSKFSDRPLRVTILLVFVLCITSWSALRVYSAVAHWDTLEEFGALPVYIIFSGLLWAAAGLWLTYALRAGQRLAFAGGLTLAGLYFAWYWFDRLIMQPSPAPNLIFSIAASVLLLAIFAVGLFLARNFFDR